MDADFGRLRFYAATSKEQLEERHEADPVKEQSQKQGPDQMTHYLSSVAIKKSLRPSLRSSSRAAIT